MPTSTLAYTNINTCMCQHQHLHIPTSTLAYTNINTCMCQHQHLLYQHQHLHINTCIYQHQHLHVPTSTFASANINTCICQHQHLHMPTSTSAHIPVYQDQQLQVSVLSHVAVGLWQEGKPYCLKDFESECKPCHKCSEKISDGLMVKIFDIYFHSEHFVCGECNDVIQVGSEVGGDKDAPLCEEHSKKKNPGECTLPVLRWT